MGPSAWMKCITKVSLESLSWFFVHGHDGRDVVLDADMVFATGEGNFDDDGNREVQAVAPAADGKKKKGSGAKKAKTTKQRLAMVDGL